MERLRRKRDLGRRPPPEVVRCVPLLSEDREVAEGLMRKKLRSLVPMWEEEEEGGVPFAPWRRLDEGDAEGVTIVILRS